MQLKTNSSPGSVPARMWKDAEFADLLQISVRTPAQWRYLGKFKDELPFVKIGRTVRYTDEVVAKFIQKNMVGGTFCQEGNQ